jgi:hypothetical protein
MMEEKPKYETDLILECQERDELYLLFVPRQCLADVLTALKGEAFLEIYSKNGDKSKK